jgi:hypothetical protein
MIRLCLCYLVLMSAAWAEGQVDIFADLAQGGQERLYYDSDALPEAVQSLIAAPISVAQVKQAYDGTTDELRHFNLVLILGKKLAKGLYAGDELAQGEAFLRSTLTEANPWVKTEALYALGEMKAQDSEAVITACFNDRSKTVTYHAVVAYFVIYERMPELTPQQGERVAFVVNECNGLDEKNTLADQELNEYIRSRAY